MSGSNIKDVLLKHTDSLMTLPGVVGVAEGVSHGRPCIMVLVLEMNAEFLRRIPDTLEDYPVEIEESGQFRAVKGRV